MTRSGIMFALTVAATALAVACGDGSTDPPADSAASDVEIEIVGGSDQRGLGGWPLGEVLSVRAFHEDVSSAVGVPVDFAVTEGFGRTSPRSDTTDALGLASTEWTLGSASVRTQVVMASVEAGIPVRFEATSVDPDEADLVVVHGAPQGLRGFVLVRQTTSLDVLGFRAAADTLIHLPPQGRNGAQLVLFGTENRPERAAPSWTSGVDTVHVEMRPPVAVSFVIHVRAGDFGTRRDATLQQLDSTESIWRDEAMGLRVGDVTFLDEITPGVDVDGAGPICQGPMPEDAIHVHLITSINGNVNLGFGCVTGYIGMSIGADQIPYLLAHEVGHTFSLGHTADGMMDPSGTERTVRDGETFRAHFSEESVLNTIFDAQPSRWRTGCNEPPWCLPLGLDILDGTLDLAAARTDGGYPGRGRVPGRRGSGLALHPSGPGIGGIRLARGG